MTFLFQLGFHSACFVSADGKQTILFPSGAGTLAILGLKVQWRGKRKGFNFCRSLSFLPFSRISSLLIPLPPWLGPHASIFHLHWFVISVIADFQPSVNYSDTTEREKERKRDFVSTSIWENKYLMITYFACSKWVWSWFTHQKCQKTNGAP